WSATVRVDSRSWRLKSPEGGDLAICRNKESRAPLRTFGHLQDLREAAGKLVHLVPESKVGPSGLQKKDRVPRFLPCPHVVGVATVPYIRCDDDPVGFLGKALHPLGVFGVRRKAVTQVDDLVVRFNQWFQAVGDSGGEVVIEEEVHAA